MCVGDLVIRRLKVGEITVGIEPTPDSTALTLLSSR
jgi:hypothetical protein